MIFPKISFRALSAVGLYAAAYGAALMVLGRSADFEAGESLAVLLIFGLGFSVIAWLVTIGMNVPKIPLINARRESVMVVIYLCLFALLFLGWGLTQVKAAAAPGSGQDALVLAAKLLTMVAIPAWLFTKLGYSWHSLLGFTPFRGPTWRVFLLMLVVLAALQLLIGRGAKTISALPQSAAVIATLAPLAWAWLTLEAGLTEEFLFRVLLQTRLAELARSETVGIVVMAVLFGLAHAPGYVLRGAHLSEGMGAAPDILTASAYAFVVVSPIGFMFGVLWARTRNLWLLALLHGWTDLFPNLAKLVQHWLG